MRNWLADLQRGELVPFSMQIGNRPAEFKKVSARESFEDSWHELLIVYEEVKEPLTIFLRCRYKEEFMIIQQRIRLLAEKNLRENIGQIKILDILVPHEKKKKIARLYGITGGVWDAGGPINVSQQSIFPPRGLKPWEEEIDVDEAFCLDSDLTGRSSNKEIPLWLYAEADKGLWLGPEWSGSWKLEIKRGRDSSRLEIALPTFDFTMFQGEEIELPAVALGLYTGSPEAGFNALRKVIGEYYLPRIEGSRPSPPVLFQGLNGLPSYQDEPTLYEEVDQAARVGCEAFVLDAGWNMSPQKVKWWEAIGDWRPNQERFPQGIVRLAEYIHGKGMKFGLWVEPRAHQDSEAFLKNKGSLFLPLRLPSSLSRVAGEFPINHPACVSHHLLDLGREAAEDFFVKQLEKFVLEYKADWIWFDFNTEPRTLYWDCYEESNRKGLMELGFYQGLYKAFEIIHQKYPSVWLETCASGGRLIDLAQLKHFHSIWINDQSTDYDQNRNYRSAMNRLLPAVYLQSAFFINAGVLAKKPQTAELESHHLLISFGGMFQFGQGLCFWKESDIKEASRYVSKYKKYRHYLKKNYYELFALPESKNAWDGWQYHDPESRSGILILFRLKESKEDEKTVKVRGLKDGQYLYSVVLGKAKIKENKVGLMVHLIPDTAVLIHYEHK